MRDKYPQHGPMLATLGGEMCWVVGGEIPGYSGMIALYAQPAESCGKVRPQEDLVGIIFEINLKFIFNQYTLHKNNTGYKMSNFF